MQEGIFLFALVLVWVFFASAQDLKKREVADWLNFSLLIFVIGFLFFNSLFSGNWNILYQGLFGFAVFFVLANFFYYARFFAGGDAKLMIALGPAITFAGSFKINLELAGLFLLFFMFIGSFYGIIWTVFLSVKNCRFFKKELFKNFNENKNRLGVFLLSAFLFFFIGFFYSLFFIISFIFLFIPFAYIYARAVENTCMIKKVDTEKLTEGDWLYKDVRVKGKLIKSNWEGLSKKEILFLKENKKFVLIKEGIPFVPVFLLSYIVLLLAYFMFYI